MINIEDFKKLEIKIGKVLSAEKVLDADRLLKLSIDLGEELPRTIVSGIAEHVSIDNLVGKSLPILANLEPRVIRGIESRGMILAASNEEQFSLLVADKEIKAGSFVK